MDKKDIKTLVEIRKYLIEKYERCKDYRTNKNAIMRELDHAEIVHTTVVKLDKLLSKYVSFD